MKNLCHSMRWGKSQCAFATAISDKHLDNVEKWSKMRDVFDKDPTKPNPYEEPKAHQLTTTFCSIYSNLLYRHHPEPTKMCPC